MPWRRRKATCRCRRGWCSSTRWSRAPPSAALEQVARAIRAGEPEARIVVLLIDERPEELTYFRRAVSAEVFASSTDQSPAEHTALNELMLAHIRVELECGNEVVVLLDSLT